MSIHDDRDWPDIAAHPVDPADHDLIWTGAHHYPEYERLNFRHKTTGVMIYRRRLLDPDVLMVPRMNLGRIV